MFSKGHIIENEIKEKLKEVEEQHNIEFSTTQKILLCIQEPVTTILDVLYGEVNLFMLDQHLEDADENIANLLKVNEGDKIDYREAIVHKNGRPLVYAQSYIPISRCGDPVREDLSKKHLPTGTIMTKNMIETLRVITEISIENPNALLQELFHTDEPLISRSYVMIQHKKPVIWTQEKYPLSYFKI